MPGSRLRETHVPSGSHSAVIGRTWQGQESYKEFRILQSSHGFCSLYLLSWFLLPHFSKLVMW